MPERRTTWGWVRIVLIGACTGSGLIIAWPFPAACLRYQHATGSILEVFTTPVDAGHVSVSIAYEYSPNQDPRCSILGYVQGDGDFRAMSDPVMSNSEAEAFRELLEPPGAARAAGRVFYEANDPVGSAFIITDARIGLRRLFIGMLLVTLSLVLSLPPPGWLGRRRKHA